MYNKLIGTVYEWIPNEWKYFYAKMVEHDAWYSGCPERLANVYAGVLNNGTNAGYQWGRDLYEERATMLHIPIAGDIAGTSAALLFGESPRFTIPEEKTQERLDEIIKVNELDIKLLESAETCAALSGIFLKINWDVNFMNMPIISSVQPDRAFPKFKWGFLQEVTFWEIIEVNEKATWRLLEKYEKGQISYQLFLGDSEKLGTEVSLESHPSTQGLIPIILTGIDDILCRYVPNVKPNKQFRHSDLGQSDFQSLEGLMDALDATYTAWMKEIDLAKAKLLVPEEWMELSSNGKPIFNKDQEVFVKLGIDTVDNPNAKPEIVQFAIRTEEFYKTCFELFLKIITLAGYSPQTFGLDIDKGAESGKAKEIAEKKTGFTKGKKSKYWKVALEEILQMVLQLDRNLFNVPNSDERPTVEFTDSTGFNVNTLSETIERLERGKSASTEIRVKMLHPDWDDTMVDEEVQRIKEENDMFVEETFKNNNDF